MRIRTFFLDQGETLGGAERFLLDFFSSLSEAEIQKIKPAVIGAKSDGYKKLLRKKIPVFSFYFPSLKGGIIKKGIASIALIEAAICLKKIIIKEGNSLSTQVFANTPRAIFITYIAKQFFRMPGKISIMIHDFTIPKWFMKRFCRIADIIVVNSMITRQIIRKQISEKDSKKIKIIENGVDFQAVKKIPEKLPTKIEKIVLLGRIDPQKGQKYLVEAADLLLERNPDIQFFIIGNPFKEDPSTIKYNHEIRTFVKQRNLKNVFFINEVESPYEVFASADMALVLPTEPETFGRVVIEAMAMNTIVLAFDQTGPKQILKLFCKSIKKSQEFLLVEPENAMSLAEKIGFFADNIDEAEPFLKQGKAFVEKNYNLKDTTKHLLQILIRR